MRKSDEEKQEKPRKYFRAGTRFFQVDGLWYYTTREGDTGPFRTEELARRGLATYLDLESMKADQREKITRIRDGLPKADPKIWDKLVDQ